MIFKICKPSFANSKCSSKIEFKMRKQLAVVTEDGTCLFVHKVVTSAH